MICYCCGQEVGDGIVVYVSDWMGQIEIQVRLCPQCEIEQQSRLVMDGRGRTILKRRPKPPRGFANPDHPWYRRRGRDRY